MTWVLTLATLTASGVILLICISLLRMLCRQVEDKKKVKISFPNILTSWMHGMVSKYPDLEFLYYYSECRDTHYISVSSTKGPSEGEEYSKDELDFSFELGSLFPHETVLFCSNQELFHIPGNSLLIKNERHDLERACRGN